MIAHLSKNPKKEELIDLIIYRPIAYLIISVLSFLPLTPNHYSLMALISGLMASLSLFVHMDKNILMSNFFMTLFCIFDCCDGMQARMKKNGSPNGKLIDGIVDYTVNIVFYITLIFFINYQKPQLILTIGIFISGIFKILHSLIYDLFIDNITYSDPKILPTNNFFALYFKLRNKIVNLIPRSPILLFRFIGPTSHCFVLMLSLYIGKLSYYIFFSVFLSNIILIINLLLDKNIKQQNIS